MFSNGGFPDNYNPKMTWVKKIIFAIGALSKPCTTAEIVDYLISIEPALGRPRTKSIGSVSAILSVNKGDLFTKEKNKNGETEFYFE